MANGEALWPCAVSHRNARNATRIADEPGLSRSQERQQREPLVADLVRPRDGRLRSPKARTIAL